MSRLISLAFICLLLTSCGFQPRGSLPLAQQLPWVIYIKGLNESSDFGRVLTAELKAAGATLYIKQKDEQPKEETPEAENADEDDSAQEANSRLRIFAQESERVVLSLDSRAKIVEYELQERLTFKFRRPDGSKSGKRSLVARRILFNPPEQLLGRSREELLLKQDMYRELSRQIINQMAATP